MTISWGTKIAILYIGFVLLISTLVWKSMHQKVDLVAEDYYQQEVTFQHHLDAANNGNGLAAAASVGVSRDSITIRFPAEFRDRISSGNVHFYAPINGAFDKTFPFKGTGNEMQVARRELAAAHYKVKLSWTAGGKEYYQESDLNLQP